MGMDIATPKENHDHSNLDFPEGFLWGAATSSHQVEGDNINSDWWAWEQGREERFRSREADDQYNLFEEDFKLLKTLAHNAHRLSIEWSRIEPAEGVFNQTAIDHYVQVLKSLKSRGITVMLTLHHFTNPVWFMEKGGWESGKSIKYFSKYVEKVVPHFGDYVDLWCTINEPGVYMHCGFVQGKWPPNKRKAYWSAFWVYKHMADAHKRAYQIIHNHRKSSKVGIAHNVTSFNAFHKHSFLENAAVWLVDNVSNHAFFWLSGKNTHDYIGLNYYIHQNVSFNGEAKLPTFIDVTVTKKAVSDLGWEIHPEGIFDVIMDFSDYHKPIYITENGVASTNDDRRVRFILAYLQEIYHGIAAGVDVRGYFYWSFLDNFEWAEGFTPRFGLVEVDYKTQKRTPRPSAFVYREIIKQNGIPHHLLKLLGHSVRVNDVLKEL